jgi:hypothetical protein
MVLGQEASDFQCTVVAMPAGESHGLGKFWIHHTGVLSHWSQGVPVNVFEGCDPTIFIAATLCPAAERYQGCRATFTFRGDRFIISAR